MCEMVTRTSRLTKTVLSSRKEISRDYVPSDGVKWLVSAFFLFFAIRLIMLSMHLLSISGTISRLRSIGDCCDCRDDNGLMSTVSCTPRLHHPGYKLDPESDGATYVAMPARCIHIVSSLQPHVL
jgi:hypothetical protein